MVFIPAMGYIIYVMILKSIVYKVLKKTRYSKVSMKEDSLQDTFMSKLVIAFCPKL